LRVEQRSLNGGTPALAITDMNDKVRQRPFSSLDRLRRK